MTPEETRALFVRLHADRGRWHDRGRRCHDAFCVDCYDAMFDEEER